MDLSSMAHCHIRPYAVENTGSRPLSPSQTTDGQTSTQVGDHWGIPGVVCFVAKLLLHCGLHCLGYPWQLFTCP
ncbi:Putative protein of unknown function [Podospora comata]|uniref:Uncharacterized protein n=1 Tax=Podospora comata TaxID=48703 RepID=A0ABY6SAN2_PODCO|nr:Putative protein of unknown function [Podospora comata]